MSKQERIFDSRDDAVYEELQKGDSEQKPLTRDEDLPGMGQYYCLHCDRYFANLTVRDEHFKTKRHKKRLRQMSGPAPHTQLDAELAAGMGMPDNGPTLMSIGFLVQGLQTTDYVTALVMTTDYVWCKRVQYHGMYACLYSVGGLHFEGFDGCIKPVGLSLHIEVASISPAAYRWSIVIIFRCSILELVCAFLVLK
ncbi:hypothetical protein CRYUN_Cryun05aG0235300 [Craigia yunnanensis]